MYITEFEINNLRCFEGTHKISLDRGDGTYAGWTVFVGRNGSGKSTLLKALAGAYAGREYLSVLESGVPRWMTEGARKSHIVLRLLAPAFRRDVEPSEPRYAPVGLQWRRRGKADMTVTEDPGFGHSNPWTGFPHAWMLAAYGPFRHLGPTTVDVLKMSADPVLASLVNLFRVDATLGDAVDWLKERHARALERRHREAELRDGVLALLNDGLLPDGSTVARVDSDGLWITRAGFTFPLRQVSDGYRTVAALVVDLVQRLSRHHDFAITRSSGGWVCNLQGVVLIDEIDAHLHVEWQQRIGPWLTRHFPKLQFLVTSHSPFVCQAASPRGIIRLPGPGEKRKIEHLDPRVFQAVVHGGVDRAVMSELFGLDHAHSPHAEALRQDLAAVELRLLRGKASKKDEARHAQLKAQLPDSLSDLVDQKARVAQAIAPPARARTKARAPATSLAKAGPKRAAATRVAKAGSRSKSTRTAAGRRVGREQRR